MLGECSTSDQLQASLTKASSAGCILLRLTPFRTREQRAAAGSLQCCHRASSCTSASNRFSQCLFTCSMAGRASAGEAAELVSSKGYKYLDVRTPEEFSAGHPKDSVNIPLMLRTSEGMVPNPEFMQTVKESLPEVASPVVLGCKAGNRSARACAMLQMEGYSNVVDNTTGYDGWVAEKLPVEK